MRRAIKAFRYAQDKPGMVTLPNLQSSILRFVGYSDGGYFSNHDLTSQIGRTKLIMDESGASSPIIFSSYKSRRVARSVLSAERNAFADLFDDAYALRSQIENTLNHAVPMHFLTDSKSLFEIISKGRRMSEKRIMLDIHAARQACKLHEISNIGS